MTIGISTAPLRRRSSGGPVDPATMGLSLLLEQRGDTNDYAQSDGIWEDRGGAGRNFTQGTAGLRPPVAAAAVNGKTPPQWVAADADLLTSTATIDDLGDATAITLSLLVYVDSASGNWVGADTSPGVLGDTAGWFRLVAGKDGGTYRIGCAAYTSAYVFVNVPIVPDTWHELNLRLSGGRLTVALDAPPVHAVGPDTAESKSCGAIGAVNVALRMGGVGATYWSGRLLSLYAKAALADADFATFTAWRKALYPSAGLP